jgi:hypothetical protein
MINFLLKLIQKFFSDKQIKKDEYYKNLSEYVAYFKENSYKTCFWKNGNPISGLRSFLVVLEINKKNVYFIIPNRYWGIFNHLKTYNRALVDYDGFNSKYSLDDLKKAINKNEYKG